MFELHVQSTDISTGTVPITWCLDKGTLALINDRANYKPRVILIVTDHLLNEDRIAADLTDGVAYVGFKRPGEHVIRALIVEQISSEKVLHDVYFVKHNRCYETTLLDSSGEYKESLREGDIVLADPLVVTVPDEAFAAEPPAWLNTWANWMFVSRLEDQCNFRRRVLFSFFVQPAIFVLNFCLRLAITLFAFFFGARGFSFRYLNMFGWPFESLHHLFDGGTIFIRSIPEPESDSTAIQVMKYIVRSLWTVIFMPWVALGIFALWYYGVLALWYYGVLVNVTLVLCGAVLFVSIIALLATGAIGNIVDRLFPKKPVKSGTYDYLICTGEPMKVVKNRTIKLKYLALKSKICKPFAR